MRIVGVLGGFNWSSQHLQSRRRFGKTCGVDPEVSFFSIGTNDLIQYVMATDRANAQIASLYRTEHQAVMRAIELTNEAAQRAGIWVGICGEAAADVALMARFIKMGVTDLSMSPASILAAKKRITELCLG